MRITTIALTLVVAAFPACGEGSPPRSTDAGENDSGDTRTAIHVSGLSAPGARVSAGDDECVVPCTVHAQLAGCADVGVRLRGATSVDLVLDIASRCNFYRSSSGMPSATVIEVNLRLKRDSSTGMCVAALSSLVYETAVQSALEPIGLDDEPCAGFTGL